MQIKDLLIENDKLSHTKLWSNIAYAVGSAVVIIQAYKGSLSVDIFGVYMAVVGLHTIASKWVGTQASPPPA